MRKRFGLESSDTGLVVLKLDDDSEDYPLQVDDVMTHVGTYDIDNDGMVRLENGLRFRFHYFVPKLVKDGKYPATVIRNGEKMEVQIPAGPRKPKVIRTLKGKYPDYFVYGPLVFVEATTEYLEGIGQLIASSNTAKVSAGYRWMSSLIFRESPLISRGNDSPAFEGEHNDHGCRSVVASPNQQGLLRSLSQCAIQNQRNRNQEHEASGPGLARF